MTDTVKTIGENELKTSLIDQVSNFMEKNSLKFDQNATNQSFQFEKNDDFIVNAQCGVLCPVCDDTKMIRFDKYWRVSNFYKHIRNHSNKSQKSIKLNGKTSKSKEKNCEINDGSSSNVKNRQHS